MPYIGNDLATQFQAFATQTITGDGSTSYTLDRAVANGKELLVYINNVKQEEGSGKSYEASGTTITFSEAVASGDSCYLVYMGSAQQTVTAPAGSIVSGQIANANLEMPNTLDMNGKELILDADGDTSIQASSDDTIVFESAGSERMRIDSSGNFLVAKSAADSTVVGIEAKTNGQVIATRDAGQSATFARITSDGEIVRLKKDSTTVGKIGIQSSGLFIDGESAHAGIRFASTNWIPRRSDNDDDNIIALGSSSLRFDDAFITNGVTTGSDQNEKQDIASATAKELKVASKLSALFKTYKWKDAVAEKGDKARTHTGIVAQEVQSAFEAEGLDASNYGMFMSDTWWEKEISVDAVEADEEKGIEAEDAYTYIDTKDEKTDGYTEKTRLGVRYPELFSFIFSSIEARLTALEGK